jgi:dTDP-4-amino-4,6-dideoxygalactose transaminase
MTGIPFNEPAIVGKELYYISQAIHGRHASGNGPFTRRCQELLERCLGVPKVLLTTSCTDALEMAAVLLDIQPGDEVIVPSFTFVSTANAFVLHGARPAFVDIRPDTLNMDEALVERLITPKTKAIVPVHYGGVGCEMDAICDTARRYGVALVEDNAHGLFGTYREKQLGTFGTFAAQSFHETKNFMCGEGGALVINDQRYISRAEIIWEKGTDRSRFFRGQVDRYTWVDVGSSHLPSDILAAFLFAQLEAQDSIQGKRRKIWQRYANDLREWAERYDVQTPVVPAYCDQAYHLFYLILPTPESRDGLIEHLKVRGIQAVFHYLPLHLSPMGRRFGGEAGDCPVTERVSDRMVRLPFYNEMTGIDQGRVVEAITAFEVARRRAIVATEAGGSARSTLQPASAALAARVTRGVGGSHSGGLVSE